jgi:hypothetical protein
MLQMRTCSRCGARSQDLDLGRTRCFACGNVFNEEPPPREEEPDTYPVEKVEDPPPPERRMGDRPLCPRCHRPGTLQERECGYCGYLFGDGLAQGARRDLVPHRGPLIDRLGATAALAGGAVVLAWPLGLVVEQWTGVDAWITAVIAGPLALVVALVTGILVCWMATDDLARMKTGEVDPAGRHRTEMGRLTGGLGIGLGFGLGVACAAYWLIRLG